MCEAVLAQLLPFERRTCTSGPPERWPRRAPGDVVTAGAVSMHWTAAGVADQAAEWSLRAARTGPQP